MPVALLNKIADSCGIPMSELEGKWEEAKAGAKKKGFEEDSDRFYQYVVGVLKKMVGPECAKKMGWKSESRASSIQLLLTKIKENKMSKAQKILEQGLSSLGKIPCPACGYVGLPTKEELCVNCGGYLKEKKKLREEDLDEKSKDALKAAAKHMADNVEKIQKKGLPPAKRTDLEKKYYKNMIKTASEDVD